MITIPISASVNYDVKIGENILDHVGVWTKELNFQKYKNIGIITDSNVDQIYADRVSKVYTQAGFAVSKFIIPAGEPSKNINTIMEIISFLQKNSFTRTDALVALGGGVVGDISGFVASIYLRGIDFIQIPTTLLSAIDSSVGGKTGINIPEGKNLVGAFWQPRLVICDITTLSTLPKDDFAAGVSEAIKYGCIWDEQLFSQFESLDWSGERLKSIIARCVEIKAEVVAEDEKENGLRAILNFGHTVAHAIEKTSNLKISHGFAVGIGMCIAAKAGETRGLTKPGTSERIKNLLKLHGIPTATAYPADILGIAALGDKKRSGDSIKFIIISEIGKYDYLSLSTDEIESFIESGLSNFDVIVHPGDLTGNVKAPSSKSDAHRAVISAALSKGVSRIDNFGNNDDIKVTIDAVKALGAVVSLENNALEITGIKNTPKSVNIYCKESGSTLRFIVPIAAALGVQASFYGEGRLPQRPMTPFLEILEEKGIIVLKKDGEMFSIEGKLKPGEYKIPGNISSQYITGLLFSLSLLDAPSEIIITSPLESEKYIDMTIKTLKDFGVRIEKTDKGYGITPGEKYKSCDYSVEGDYSGGAFWLCAGAMGHNIQINGLQKESMQADRDILDVIKDYGCETSFIDEKVIIKQNTLKGIKIDASGIPDSVPILSVLASFAGGTTTIFNAQRLKIKESDRLISTSEGLNKLGASVEITNDGLIIEGGNLLKGGVVSSFDDHRIAMAMAIAALKSSGSVQITNAQCVQKSYPNFFIDLEMLGGIFDVI